MADAQTRNAEVDALLLANEQLVTRYYRLAAFLLVGLLFVHVLFAAWLLLQRPAGSTAAVWQFAAFNATVLVVEVILCRVAFMLGARAGQLRDLRAAVLIAAQPGDLTRLEAAARTLMSLRRDEARMKVLDVEALAAAAPKGDGA